MKYILILTLLMSCLGGTKFKGVISHAQHIKDVFMEKPVEGKYNGNIVKIEGVELHGKDDESYLYNSGLGYEGSGVYILLSRSKDLDLHIKSISIKEKGMRNSMADSMGADYSTGVANYDGVRSYAKGVNAKVYVLAKPVGLMDFVNPKTGNIMKYLRYEVVKLCEYKWKGCEKFKY
jgi:hypothetical protein